MRTEVELFFSAIGMPILPGYGLTEAAPLVSFNRPDAFKVGTAGIVMRGGEIRIEAPEALRTVMKDRVLLALGSV